MQKMEQAYYTGDYTLKDVAGHFDAHYSTVSRVIQKAEAGVE